MKKVMCVFGTRPEAIKVAPVIHELKSHTAFELCVCVTAQHRQMLDQVLELFEITPDIDLDIMTPDQNLSNLTAQLISEMSKVLSEEKPDCVLVHGDTTTTMATSLAAYYQKIPVGHIEAGLRTHDIYAPWPEEINRQITGRIATFHFAPTQKAQENLLGENVPEDNIFITGNTIVDALTLIKQRVTSPDKQKQYKKRFDFLESSKKLILVTGHRRENFGEAFEEMCHALKAIAERDDVEIIFPVHLNPYVQKCVKTILSEASNIHLIEPVDYEALIYLMNEAYLIITDSGGIQEEAPSFGKPVLVTRNKTERPEGVEAGVAFLVGTKKSKIVKKVSELLTNEVLYKTIAKIPNPYGDGKASQRISAFLDEKLEAKQKQEAA